MALYNYFSKLGSINYNGEIVNNIIVSIRFKELVLNNNIVFYPYTIKEGERPDSIAYSYYDDERYAWLVYLSNTIIDPYFEWPLSASEFNNFIVKKYGSIETSINKIAFYRNNWYKDESIISISAYSALSSDLKKYWNPIVGYNGEITTYSRKEEDRSLETNKVVEVTVSSSSGYVIDEKISQKTSGVITATGNIKAINGNILSVANIAGEFLVTAGSVGSILNNSQTISRSATKVTVINTAIPSDEAVYWEPVSNFDYENELNESRKTIRLVDRQYLNLIEDQISELV